MPGEHEPQQDCQNQYDNSHDRHIDEACDFLTDYGALEDNPESPDRRTEFIRFAGDDDRIVVNACIGDAGGIFEQGGRFVPVTGKQFEGRFRDVLNSG